MKRAFFDKLLEKLDRLDPKETRRLLQNARNKESFFAQVLDSLVEGVVIIDLERRVESLNISACELLQLKANEICGELVDKAIPILQWEEMLQQGRSSTRDVELLGAQPKLLNCYLTPIFAEEKKQAPLGYVLLVRDVTKTRLRTAEQMEEEKLEALTMLAAGVAHELGNPLNSLDIHLQLLQRNLDQSADLLATEKMEGLLQTARGEVERLDGLIKQFLQALRPADPVTELASVNEVVMDSIEFLRSELEDGGVNLLVNLDEGLPPLHLDPGQIRQALYNVLRNARQALPGALGQVCVTTSLTGEYVRICVADNGVGMQSDQVGRAFQGSQSTRKQGHGLGLLVVRRIIRAHGGQIGLASEAGQGTEVTLDLPLAPKGMRLLPHQGEEVIDV